MSDDDLLERAFLGELSAEEEETLVGRLQAEPGLARRMVERSRDEAVLSEWAAERRALLHESSPSAQWRMGPLVSAAAILLFGILSFAAWFRFLRSGPDALQTAEVIDAVDCGELKVGDRLSQSSLECGPGGHATLRFPDDTTIEVRENTDLDLRPSGTKSRNLRLRSGTLIAQVTKLEPGAYFEVASPHAEIRVLGTRFEVTVEGAATRLGVEEGRVSFRPSGGKDPVFVTAGQSAIAETGRPVEVFALHGGGLTGEYYDRPDFTHPKVSRRDATVDFEWGTGSSDPAIRKDGFSVRWSGRVLPKHSGTYTFATLTEGGVRLFVDGKFLVDQSSARGRTEGVGELALKAWRPVDLRMEYLAPAGPGLSRLSWSGPRTPREVVPPEALFPPPSGGTGLKGEYFGTELLTDLKFARVDSVVDFAWGLTRPHPSMPQEHFSVRWTGQVEPARTETVTFSTVSDDGVRLWVDGVLLIDDWTVRGTTERSGQLALVAGRRYDLRLEYFQSVSTANVKLLWASPGQAAQIIPPTRLFPAP
jgi:ferric-dicitrate binding protein FerR (iron transport regulator)